MAELRLVIDRVGFALLELWRCVDVRVAPTPPPRERMGSAAVLERGVPLPRLWSATIHTEDFFGLPFRCPVRRWMISFTVALAGAIPIGSPFTLK